MAYDPEKHFTDDELAMLAALFGQQRLHGHYQVEFAAGLSVTARLHIVVKPPMPRWLRLLAAAPPESLGVRRP